MTVPGFDDFRPRFTDPPPVRRDRLLTELMSMRLPGVHLACSAVGLVFVAGVAGCGSPTTSASPPSSVSTTASSSPAPVGPTSGVSNGQTYPVAPSSSTGATPDGHGTWTLKLLTISGGDGKVADAFNTAVQASAQQLLDAAKRDAAPATTWDFQTAPHIFFSSASVSEQFDGVYFAQGAAHPIDTASTVVIDSRMATPITLKDLFVSEQAGLDRLSQQTKQLLPAVLGIGPAPIADQPGSAAVEANFANWVPTPQGIQISFNDGQFSQSAPPHGVPPLTIPWSAVDDLLAPGMTALRQPS